VPHNIHTVKEVKNNNELRKYLERHCIIDIEDITSEYIKIYNEHTIRISLGLRQNINTYEMLTLRFQHLFKREDVRSAFTSVPLFFT